MFEELSVSIWGFEPKTVLLGDLYIVTIESHLTSVTLLHLTMIHQITDHYTSAHHKHSLNIRNNFFFEVQTTKLNWCLEKNHMLHILTNLLSVRCRSRHK